MENEKEKTVLDTVQEALNTFWGDHHRRPPIKARHTEIDIKPKFFIGGELNPQVAQKIVEVYLRKATLKHILDGRLVINPESIQIKDEIGKTIIEVNSPAFAGRVINQATVFLGRYLAEKNAIPARPNHLYSFGDIHRVLIEFLKRAQKCDSKNLLKDAAVLLLRNK
jgi:hypothetical protein